MGIPPLVFPLLPAFVKEAITRAESRSIWKANVLGGAGGAEGQYKHGPEMSKRLYPALAYLRRGSWAFVPFFFLLRVPEWSTGGPRRLGRCPARKKAFRKTVRPTRV